MFIKLENLKKTYRTEEGAIQAVNNISLDIPENTIFGIIGKSGAGKSTLVRLISLLERPDSGAIYYNDARVDNLEKKALILQRRKIGMIFQNFNLLSSRTAAKNVAYPLEICKTPKEKIKERVLEMLDLVGLKDRADSPISTLSGGQKQRVAIARALASKPDILFCDEATSALDPETTNSILNLIRNIQKQMNLTVVMITHQMEVVRDACEKVAVIENGRVAELGNVHDIFARPKSEVTKTFLSRISPSAQPKEGERPSILRWSEQGGRYTLRFVGACTGMPILSRVSQKFNVELNIRAGGVQHLPQNDVGTIITDIDGPAEEVSKALGYLAETGIGVEENT